MKKLILILLFFSLIFFSGCFNQQSLRDIAIVVGMGIDNVSGDNTVDDQEIILTIEIADLSEGTAEETKTQSKLFSSRGKTIIEAVNGLKNQINKDMFWGHLHVIIFGGEALKNSIIPYLDFFIKSQEISPMTNVVYTDIQAKELLSGKCGVNFSTSLGMTLIMEEQRYESGNLVTNITIQELIEKMLIPDTAVILPRAVLIKNEKKDDEETEKSEVKFVGLMIMGHDGKFKGYLEDKENLGTLLWFNYMDSFSLSIIDDNGDKLSFEVNDWKLKKSWDYDENGELKLILNINYNTVLLEDSNPSTTSSNLELENLYEQKINDLLLKAWNKSLDINQDFLLTGDHMKKYFPGMWKIKNKKWPEEMKNINMRIITESKLKTKGK